MHWLSLRDHKTLFKTAWQSSPNSHSLADHHRLLNAQSELLDRAKERVKRDAADLTVTSTWAGSSVGLIRSVEPAQSLITHLVKDAAAILKASGQALEDDSLDLGICT